MREEEVNIGMRVRIMDIQTTIGYSVDEKYLKARRINDDGTVIEMIPGHGGEVFAVIHDDGYIAVYHASEFAEIKGEGMLLSRELQNLFFQSQLRYIFGSQH